MAHLRFLAFTLGCLFLVQPTVRAALSYKDFGLKSGPLVGHTTAGEINVWVQTGGAAAVRLGVADNEALEGIVWGEPVSTVKDRHFTGVVRVAGLKPATRYWYTLQIDGKQAVLDAAPPSMRTLPDPAAPSKVRIGIGSCLSYMFNPNPRIWKPIHKEHLDAFLWMGDNVYGDTLSPEVLFDKHIRNRNTKPFQPVMMSVPQWATWDDHDFGLNDTPGEEHPYKEKALEVFTQVWANPSYGEPDNPGIYSSARIGGVEVFLLDARYHRNVHTMPDGPDKHFLGPKQVAWLKKKLKASTAPFKLLVSGSPWNDGMGPGGNSYSGFRHERTDLFDFIRDENITGVVLASGDSHMGELNVLPRGDAGAYDLYELVSSALGMENRGPTNKKVQRLRPLFYQDYNYGVVEVDTTVTPPTLTFLLRDSKGKPAWKTDFVLTEDELHNGRGGWQGKVAQ